MTNKCTLLDAEICSDAKCVFIKVFNKLDCITIYTQLWNFAVKLNWIYRYLVQKYEFTPYINSDMNLDVFPTSRQQQIN